MPSIEFGCLPTIIGSMPHTDPRAACSLISHCLRDIPAWPQLPKRSFLENMYVQYSEGFPGVVVAEGRIYIDRSQDLNPSLERLYAASLGNDVDRFPIGPEYAAGLYAFLSQTAPPPRAVKGQVTGPVTWGATVADGSRRSVIWDDTLADAAARLLRLKAGWQEKQLRQISRNTIIFVDEPYMQSYGSSSLIALSREKVVSLLEEVLGGISGLKGVHCCGNTDWSILLETSVDILSFDAYNYAQSLSIYPSEIKRFLGRHGTVAWGIVPNDEVAVAGESAASLQDRLEEAMAPFAREGIPFLQLIKQGLLTPSCGLASLTEEAAGRVLELLGELSARLRKRYI